MIRAGLHALLSHWWRRPFQLATLLLGLATATALWSGVQAINAEARASYDRAATTLAGSQRDSVVRADGAPLELSSFAALRRAGWPVSPMIEGQVPTGAGPLRVVGVDPFSLPPREFPAASGDGSEGVEFITPPGRLLVGETTAARLEGVEGLPPRVTVEGTAPDLAYADMGIAQSLLGRPGEIDRLVVTGDVPDRAPELSEVVPGLTLRSPEGGADLARLTDSFHLNLTAFGLLSFAVGLFIVRGAIGLAFEQRRPVFRTLRALGLSRRVLLCLLAGELLILALVAGTVGVLLGWLIATALLPDVAATLRGLYGAEVAGGLTLAPTWWLWGILIAVAGTAVAAAGALWQVARLPLLAPAQPRAWARASAAGMRWQGLAALALLAIGAVAGIFGDSVLFGFVLLGSVLLAAALALPLYLHAVLSLLARIAPGPRSEWFWADTKQQLPGLSLALMALLLALSANIGVGTMVSSFRLTFTGWLDQRLTAEIYVTADDDAQATEVRALLAKRTRAILPIRHVEGEIEGRSGEIYGVADDPTYTENWPLIEAGPDVWERVARGEAVLVNEQLARREGIWPGDEVSLPGWRAPVAGVYSDYGNPLPQTMIGLARFAALYPDAPDRRYAARLDPAQVRELTLALQEIGVPAGNIIDQASIKGFSLGVFERTFAVTGALNVLTLSVAGLAILTSLLTLAGMRRPQLAPVWALGMTRRSLARIELGRTVLLAALTFVAALPVGLLLAWILLAVVNVVSFGWRLPMHVFPADIAWLALLSLVAALLAALLPALHLARMAPARLLQVFAHER